MKPKIISLFALLALTALTALPALAELAAPNAVGVYMGHIHPQQASLAIAQQLLWTVVFIAAGRWMLSRGVRRLVAQGG